MPAERIELPGSLAERGFGDDVTMDTAWTGSIIDRSWFEARRLGLVFEAKVAGGKLLVCSIDLQNDLEKRPVARQLRHGLLRHMAGERFEPEHELIVEQVRSLFKHRPGT